MIINRFRCAFTPAERDCLDLSIPLTIWGSFVQESAISVPGLGGCHVFEIAESVPALVNRGLSPIAPYYLREMASESIAKALGHPVNDDEPADVVKGQTQMECPWDKQCRPSVQGKGDCVEVERGQVDWARKSRSVCRSHRGGLLLGRVAVAAG